MKDRGRLSQLIKGAGEALIVTELHRHDLIAVSFSGNNPLYDVLATDRNRNIFFIQVRASRYPSWHGHAGDFGLEIEFEERKQKVKKGLLWNPDLIWAFVVIGEDHHQDRLFFLGAETLQNLQYKRYREFLKKCGSIRPRNYKSDHIDMKDKYIMQYENNWQIFSKRRK